jgi:hypothetical protein
MRFILPALLAFAFAIQADAATSKYHYIAQAILVLKKPTPGPAPTPAPSGKCENCNGTGKLGDGTISVPCPVCGGDGIVANDTPSAQVEEPDAPAAITPTAGVFQTSLPRHHLSSPQCAGGACGVQPAMQQRRYAAPVRQRRVFSGRLFGRR